MSNNFLRFLFWVAIGLVVITLFNNMSPQSRSESYLSYPTFLAQVNQGKVHDILIIPKQAQGVFNDGNTFLAYLPMQDDPNLLPLLKSKNVDVKNIDKNKPPRPRSNSRDVRTPVIWAFMIIFLAWRLAVRLGGKKAVNPPGAVSLRQDGVHVLSTGTTRLASPAIMGAEDQLVCLKCGREDKFKDDALERQEQVVAKQAGYSKEGLNLKIYGICGNCQI